MSWGAVEASGIFYTPAGGPTPRDAFLLCSPFSGNCAARSNEARPSSAAGTMGRISDASRAGPHQ